jgi:triosephosphate isomerase
MRIPIIAGNWKMHYGRANQALQFVRQIRQPLSEIDGVERVLCPPFTVLTTLAEALRPTQVGLGAQTMHWEEKGAQTGEISPTMLVDVCDYVILGHSERRATSSSHERDASIHLKVRAALSHGLTPIICVGENVEQNEAGETHTFVGGQVRSALSGLEPDDVVKCVIAYEPIWAIGTGKASTPSDANNIIGLTIRGMIAELYGEAVAQSIRVQYGGSVNVDNIENFMIMPEVDGALVGGASLKPNFVELVRRAAATT